MLCITPREVQEQIQRVERNFRNAKRTEIRTDQGQALRDEAIAELEAELGTTPTAQQIDERFRAKLNALVEEAFKIYRAGPFFEIDLETAIDEILRMDMAPNEYGLLQRKGILKVVGYDLIERHNRKHRPGTVILYYRDRADFDPRDNLLQMLKYTLDHSQP
jgi:hypothetical protein